MSRTVMVIKLRRTSALTLIDDESFFLFFEFKALAIDNIFFKDVIN